MKKVSTAKEMQTIDQRTTNDYGIPDLELMENAGRGCVDALARRFEDDLASKRMLIFCGMGNNGGDGFVIARLLFNAGVTTEILLLGKRSDLKNSAAANADSAYKLGINITEIESANSPFIDNPLEHCDIIIDALFGTGLSKPASGLYEHAINKINQSGKFVTAVDIPSGIDSDTGQLTGPHICADLTLALALLKRSHLLYPAAGVMGELETVDIKIPQQAVDAQSLNVSVTEEADLQSWLTKRQADSHKGTYGHTLVIAGSKGKGGAAGLTALAALRSGCGLVTLALPEGCQNALEFHPLEVMTVPAPETNTGTFSLSAKEILLEQCQGKSVVAIGPGLSTEPETVQLLKELLPAIECPLVIDADAINGLAQCPDLISKLGADTVLTPHLREMSRLSRLDIAEILENRIGSATKFTSDHSVTLILKGAASIIAQADGTVTINPTGNPGMATAGSGDVLTGIIAGLIAGQGLSSDKAAIAGAYLHGLAGDIFAQSESEASLIAGDLLRTLPESMRRILRGTE